MTSRLKLFVSLLFPYRTKSFFILLIKLFLVVYILLQTVYSLSVFDAVKHAKETQINAISLRLSLDISHIKNTFNVGEENRVTNVMYIDLFNRELQSKDYHFYLEAIASIPPETVDASETVVSLEGINNTLYVVLQDVKPSVVVFLSFWPLMMAILFSMLVTTRVYGAHVRQENKTSERVDPSILKVDLMNKCLINPVSGQQVSLANKPLCFYTALIELSVQEPTRQLNPNKELPKELEQLSKKYFSRLIELGHTIRKRPNFANNVEKTLSEIRAALDELYGDDGAMKEQVYPPKAVGEGSRSKAHNYALSYLTPDKVVIVGH